MEVEPPIRFCFAVSDKGIYEFKKNKVHFTKPYIIGFYERNDSSITPAKRIPYFIEPKKGKLPFYYKRCTDGKSQDMESVCANSNIYFNHMLTFTDKKNVRKGSIRVYTSCRALVSIINAINSMSVSELLINITRYNGDLYMTIADSKLCRIQPNRYFFADAPNKLPNTDGNWSDSQLFGVYRCFMGPFEFIYYSEIQGIIAKTEFTDLNNLHELNKCRFVLTKEMSSKNRDKKILQYNCHGKLTNVDDMYIIGKSIEHHTVSRMPKPVYLKLKIGEAFLSNFLQNVNFFMSKVNCLNTVYIFRIKPNLKSVRFQIYEGKTDKTFLTEEYIHYCQMQAK